MIVLLVYPDGNTVYSSYHSNFDDKGMVEASCYLSIRSEYHFQDYDITEYGWLDKPYEVFNEDEIGYRFYLPDYGDNGLEIVYVFNMRDFSIEEKEYPLLDYFKDRVHVDDIRKEDMDSVVFNNQEPIKIEPFREVKRI